jgi:hypothetical protein
MTCQTLPEALAFIASEYGKAALHDDQRLVALLSDLAPQLTMERNTLKTASSIGLLQILADARIKAPSEQAVAMNQCASRLYSDYGISRELAEDVLWPYAEALGWGTRPRPEPRSKPKPQTPAPTTALTNPQLQPAPPWQKPQPPLPVVPWRKPLPPAPPWPTPKPPLHALEPPQPKPLPKPMLPGPEPPQREPLPPAPDAPMPKPPPKHLPDPEPPWPQPPDPTSSSNKKPQWWKIVITVIALIALALGITYFIIENNRGGQSDK